MKYKLESLLLFFILGFFLTLIVIHSYTFYRSSLDTFTSMILPHYSNEKIQLNKLNEPIDFYVITMKNPERMENIERQLEKLKEQGTPIHLESIDAVVGVDLDLNALIKQEILSTNYSTLRETERHKKQEIGCYMSHLKTYQTIQQKQKSGYSVILEDDFDIDSEQFIQDIKKTIDYLKKYDPNFDILYLGTIPGNHGTLLKDKLYKINKEQGLEGTHGMLLNNQKINHIIKQTKVIKKGIDVELTQLCHEDKLNAYVIYPPIVNQQWEKLETTIGTDNFDIFSKSELPSSVFE
jgi:GR25 family glycosyltransferase involved in LPS biosynthesis